MTDTTNKIYTLMAFFAVGEGERSECWIANFKNEKDAKAAFKIKLRECGSKPKKVNELFDAMLSGGGSFESKDSTMWFIRNQPTMTQLDDDAKEFISWE